MGKYHFTDTNFVVIIMDLAAGCRRHFNWRLLAPIWAIVHQLALKIAIDAMPVQIPDF